MEQTGTVREMRVMGYNGKYDGDTKIIWSADNVAEIENAKRTFDDLRKKGFAAFRVNRLGNKGEQIREFDADAEKLILVPAMAGG